MPHKFPSITNALKAAYLLVSGAMVKGRVWGKQTLQMGKPCICWRSGIHTGVAI